MNEKKESRFDFQVLRRTLRYVKPYSLIFWTVLVTSLILAIASVSRPYLIKYSIDNYISNNDLLGLWSIILVMVIILTFECVLQFLFIYGANWIGQNIIQDIRTSLFKKYYRSE